MKINAGTPVYVGPPAVPPPTAFVNGTAEQLRATPYVTSGFLFNMVAGNEAPRLMVGVVAEPELTKEDFRELMGRIEELTKSIAFGSFIDFVMLDADHALTKALRSSVAPFYDRVSV